MVHYCEPQVIVSISAVREKQEQQQPRKSDNLCLIHFTLRTVWLSAPDFGAAILTLCFPQYIFTNNGNSELFTLRDRGFLVGWTFRTKTKIVLEKKGHLVIQMTRQNKHHSVQPHFFFREENETKKDQIKVTQQISAKFNTPHCILLTPSSKILLV